MKNETPLITLTTDFGWRDPYVAVMKGVIARIAPQARVIDVTHDVPPFNVVHAAHLLRCVLPWYPPGTIHVVVVDPGVGSDRRILLARCATQLVLAPDNGALTFAHRDAPIEELIVVENRRYFLPRISNTFHGRDIFAPVAAHLANGLRPAHLGRVTDRLELLPGDSSLAIGSESIAGRVVYVDGFGNLITDLRGSDLGAVRHQARRSEVLVNETGIGPLRSTYADVAPGEPLALVGSNDFLEIAVNQGSAAERFGPPGKVTVRIRTAGAEG